jgi:hypothetical protein
MNIKPESGWDAPSPATPVYPPSQTGWRRGVGCKVCERGSLVSKKIYRLSGPAVVIGYILLIPSILGVILSGLMFGAFAVRGFKASDNTDRRIEPIRSVQDDAYASFRRNCIASAQRSYRQKTGLTIALPVAEQYCECTLSEIKAAGTQDLVSTAQGCADQLVNGTLDPITPEVEAMYSYALGHRTTTATLTQHQRQDKNVARGLLIISGSIALFWMVAFFVSGLIGWLLVMKKRVLQCRLCGAVVNAS